MPRFSKAQMSSDGPPTSPGTQQGEFRGPAWEPSSEQHLVVQRCRFRVDRHEAELCPCLVGRGRPMTRKLGSGKRFRRRQHRLWNSPGTRPATRL